MGLQESAGVSIGMTSALLLVLLLASFSYASLRFDALQRAALELALLAEAACSKARSGWAGHQKHPNACLSIAILEPILVPQKGPRMPSR